MPTRLCWPLTDQLPNRSADSDLNDSSVNASRNVYTGIETDQGVEFTRPYIILIIIISYFIIFNIDSISTVLNTTAKLKQKKAKTFFQDWHSLVNSTPWCPLFMLLEEFINKGSCLFIYLAPENSNIYKFICVNSIIKTIQTIAFPLRISKQLRGFLAHESIWSLSGSSWSETSTVNQDWQQASQRFY